MRRNTSPFKRFFKKAMRADHGRLPSTFGTDKPASYPEAFAASVKGTSEKVRRAGRGRAGEVHREPVRSRRLSETTRGPHFTS